MRTRDARRHAHRGILSGARRVAWTGAGPAPVVERDCGHDKRANDRERTCIRRVLLFDLLRCTRKRTVYQIRRVIPRALPPVLATTLVPTATWASTDRAPIPKAGLVFSNLSNLIDVVHTEISYLAFVTQYCIFIVSFASRYIFMSIFSTFHKLGHFKLSSSFSVLAVDISGPDGVSPRDFIYFCTRFL